MKFRDPSIDAPGGWWFAFAMADKSYRLMGDDYPSLLANIHRFCLTNQIEVPATLPADVMLQVCLRAPPGWCVNDRMAGLSFTPAQIAAGATALFSTFDRTNLEDRPAVVAPRANTCAVCPLNTDIHCPACDRAKAGFALRVPDKALLERADLHNCAVCACFIAVKVQFTAAYLRRHAKPTELFPQEFLGIDGQRHACWMSEVLNPPKGAQ